MVVKPDPFLKGEMIKILQNLSCHFRDIKERLVKFLSMTGSVNIGLDEIAIYLKKKRNLPALLTAMEPYKNMRINFLGKRELAFLGDSTS